VYALSGVRVPYSHGLVSGITVCMAYDACRICVCALANLTRLDWYWCVRAGEDVTKFLVANGPGRITAYNFHNAGLQNLEC